MPTENIAVVPSHSFNRVFQDNYLGQFTTPKQTQTATPTGVLPGGVINMGAGGMACSSRLRILPFCTGPAGTAFYMRIYAWDHDGFDPVTQCWLPTPLVQVRCVAGQIPGPTASSVVNTSENLCDSILVQAGALSPQALGPTGEIVGFGAGSNLISMLILETRGAKKIEFEFQSDVGQSNVGMNALYARY